MSRLAPQCNEIKGKQGEMGEEKREIGRLANNLKSSDWNGDRLSPLSNDNVLGKKELDEE